MRAEILTIGDEICRGEIVNTNAAWLAAALWDLDITVAWMTTCLDDAADIEAALRTAAGRAELVLTTGGLGPTEDDLTVDVLSALAGVGPVLEPTAFAQMEAYLAKTGFPRNPRHERQVRVPAGAAVFANRAGLAPGFEVEIAGVPVVAFPGVPRELYAIYGDSGGVRERLVALREARGDRVERIARRIYRVFGRGESDISTAVGGICDAIPGASLHYQVKFPEVLVKIVVRAADQAVADQRLATLDAEVRARLAPQLYGTDDDSLAASLGRDLAALGATVATAESCTAGLVGAAITEVAGASRYFLGGAICYANEEKTRQLGVTAETLAREGAVSQACVREMASGARQRFGSTYAVAVSGIAGPGGGTPDKPVGTVWIAVAGPDPDGGPGEEIYSKCFQWPRGRDQIRTLAVYWALALLRRAVMSMPAGG